MSGHRTRYARQESVRRLALEEPSLSVRGMARRLGLAKDTVRRDLAELRQTGRLSQRTAEGRRSAEVAGAIASVVPGKRGHRVLVGVTHYYSEPGRPSHATWTGSPEELAERICAAVTLDGDQAERITAAVHAALAPLLQGGAR